MFSTSTWLLVLSISLIAIVKTLLTSPPSFVVDWLVSKIDILHPKLSDDTVTVTIDEKRLEGEDKNQIINYFNQAVFLKRYDVLPMRGKTPLVIDRVKGKKQIRFFLYIYSDRVDVFKQDKKKVIAYYLSPDSLPEHYKFNFSTVRV
jgi:hypothetical protein